MANPEHIRILEQGVEVWNKWRKENSHIKPDLERVDLHGENLQGINFSETHLRFAILIRTILRNADLRFADLYSADLYESIMRESNLRGANLTKARLGNADLANTFVNEANLNYADFRGSNFEYATFFSTVFSNTNLKGAVNLHTCNHFSPSSIDNQTIFISEHLPEEFLRGCGLSEWQIEAAKLSNANLTASEITEIIYGIEKLRSESPIQIHNLFISYSHRDSEFVEEMEKHLMNKKIRYWRDVHDAPAGPLEEIVVRAIEHNPTVLLILSENSVNSDWVEYEAEEARKLEKKFKRNVLCPIALDDSWKACNWSAVLRNQIKKYNILDFSNWKDKKDFESKFIRLLQGLDLFYKKE